MQPRYGRAVSRIGAALAAVLALAVVFQLYTSGNAVLAAACTGGFGLAFYVYTSRRTYTYRYLFPGLAGIALFIVLPLLYTVWLGFTNYSSRNLLTFERATEVLRGEVFLRDTVRYQFTLHSAPGGYRLVLHTGEDEEAPPAAGNEPSMLDEPAPGGPGSGAGPAGSDAGSAGSAGSTGVAGSTGSGSAATGSAGSAPAATSAVAKRPTTFVTPVLPLTQTAAQRVDAIPLAGSGITPGDDLPLRDVNAHRDAIKALTVHFPDGTAAGRRPE
jgi:hypothetical protein